MTHFFEKIGIFWHDASSRTFFWILADVILVIMVMTRDEYLSRGDQKL